MRRFTVLLASLLLLAACDSSDSYDQLPTAPMPADPYLAGLSAGYRVYAQSEAAEQNWPTANRLATKSIAASQGQDVAPETPTTSNDPELAAARASLIDAVTANRTTQPAAAAEATIAYDRWLITAQSSTDANRTALRRAQFADDLSNLETAHTAEPGIASPSSEPLAPVFAKAGKGPTILYFPFDRDSLGKSADTAIARIAQMIQNNPRATVNLNGHTDRAGSDAYNMNLSERRAKFVLHALAADGIPPKRMHYFAFGESDPAVPTADGVREPRNRRVEIFIE